MPTVAERTTAVIAEAAAQRNCVPALVAAHLCLAIRTHGLAATELAVYNAAGLNCRNLDAAAKFLAR